METLRMVAFAISSVLFFLLLCSSAEAEGHPHPYVNFDPGNDVFVREQVTVTGDKKAVNETIIWSEGVLVSSRVLEEPGGSQRVLMMTDGKDLVDEWRYHSRDGAEHLICHKSRVSPLFLDAYNSEISWLKDVFADEAGNVAGLERRKQPYKTLVDFEKVKECARIRKEQWEKELAKESQGKRRSRRSMIMPGTTWCGVGNVSASNERVDGNQVETDKCCRRHDMCNYTITAFSRKYHLFNFRLYTISHCECDDRFRSCLRMAHNEHSNTVGQLFFNFLSIPCFEFQRISVCRERNWYGKCLRQGTEAQAVLRDPINYYVEQR